uniref:Serpentine receptor class gamma n=1 Tax=Rhabditophanes sp. KR3021 TaxID=114890 RepID=A0AC35TXT2_9BILA
MSLLVVLISDLIKTRKNNAKFNYLYLHFVVNGIVDILHNLGFWLGGKFTKFNEFSDWYDDKLMLRRTAMIASLPILVSVMIGNLYVVANRFLSLHYIVQYKNMWKMKIVKILILIQICLPLITYGHLLVEDTVGKYNPATDSWIFQMKYIEFSWINSINLFVYSFLISLFCLIFNTINIYRYLQITKKRKADKELLRALYYIIYCIIMTIGIFGILIIASLRLYAMIVENSLLRNYASGFLTYTATALTISHPYFILLLSPSLRKIFTLYYGLKCCFKSSSSSAIHMSSKGVGIKQNFVQHTQQNNANARQPI